MARYWEALENLRELRMLEGCDECEDRAHAAEASLVAHREALHRHLDAIDGYDGTISEHGECLVCVEMEWQDPPAALAVVGREEGQDEDPGSTGEHRLSAVLVAAELPEWFPVRTSDYRLRALRDAHYAGGVGGKTVGQPGKRIAFVTFEGTAGWVSHWPKPEFVDHAFGEAFALFRNEGSGLSSAMIEAAITLTEARWGDPPHGAWLSYCFKCAGFRFVGLTKDRGLHVLRRTTAGSARPPEPDFGGDQRSPVADVERP